jgi:hypothetical protein
MKKRQFSMQKKLIIFSAVLFLSVFVLGSIFFVLLMEENLASGIGYRLTRIIETEKIKLEASVNSEIAIALKMANSPLIRRYFENPDDPEMERIAFAEFGGYAKAFSSGSVFWVNDIDKIFYITDLEPYEVDPDDPANYWYNMTLYETDVYNFNINFNPDLNVTNLWINAPVRDDAGRPLGMVGTGINISTFVNEIYENYSGEAALYLFNEFDEITGASQVSYVANKFTIDRRVGERYGAKILSEAVKLETGGTVYFELGDRTSVAALGSIPALDWHIVAIESFGFGEILRNGMTALFAIMTAVMLIIIIIFNIFGTRLLGESELAKNRVEEANETILSGIKYSSEIQRNLLPRKEILDEAFPDHSVIWDPRDIVGGDIYWAKNFDDGTALVVCDCTGHGTSGALLTMLMVSAFESFFTERNHKDIAWVMYMLDHKLKTVLNSKDDRNNSDIDDGCDLAVMFIAKDGGVTLASGNMSVFVCDGKSARRIKGQKIFVGEGSLNSKDDVKVTHIPADGENKFYIASDGLFDQPGGERGTPFGYGRFEKIILENHSENQTAISAKIWEAFEAHREAEARVDDFALITFKPQSEVII